MMKGIEKNFFENSVGVGFDPLVYYVETKKEKGGEND